MKSTLTIAAALLLAGAALAQDGFPHGGVMGIWFCEDDFSEPCTNYDTTAAPFEFYVALIDAKVSTVAGYECGFSFSDTVFLLSMTVDSDQSWLEYDNHIIAFNTPKLVSANGQVLLSSVLALYTGFDTIEITMGPSDPSTGDPDHNPWGWSWNGPLIAMDESFRGVHRCDLSSGASGEPDVVATLNGGAIIYPVEARSLTDIKRLFQ